MFGKVAIDTSYYVLYSSICCGDSGRAACLVCGLLLLHTYLVVYGESGEV